MILKVKLNQLQFQRAADCPAAYGISVVAASLREIASATVRHFSEDVGVSSTGFTVGSNRDFPSI